MTMALAGYLFSAACYGLATGYGIRFDAGHSVSTAAALAPAVVWVGLNLPATTNPGLLGVGPAVALLVLIALRRRIHEVLSHVMLFGITLGIFGVMNYAGLDEPLVGGLLAGGIYLVGDAVRQHLVSSGRASVRRSDQRTYWLLHAVLLCACGLTVLGVQEMDWPAFAAMAVVLALTKREFEAFALSRDAYDQTVSAIDQLKRRAAFSSDEGSL
jgi:hypothetical protein